MTSTSRLHPEPRFSPTRIASFMALSWVVLSITGCESLELHNAEVENTPDAYMAFLEKFPNGANAEDVRSRIEKLRFDAAMEAKTSASLREYLAQHPGGAGAEAARAAEDAYSFEEAQAAGSLEAFQGYLDGHPEGRHTQEAKLGLDRVSYRDKVLIEGTVVERINLARDAEGPLNGWEVRAVVHNRGNRTLSIVELRIDVLDAGGATIGEPHLWWAVAPNLGGYPTPEAMKIPLRPEASRSFQWTTGDVPSNWAGDARLAVSKVDFAY